MEQQPPIETRRLGPADFSQARGLYLALTRSGSVAQDPAHFAALLAHPGTSVWGAFDATSLGAMVTLHMLPNMTYGGRPYGLIENVVSDPKRRKAGFASAAMTAAMNCAQHADAYKVMLLTGQARDAKGFYERMGFSAEEKHGMIWRPGADG